MITRLINYFLFGRTDYAKLISSFSKVTSKLNKYSTYQMGRIVKLDKAIYNLESAKEIADIERQQAQNTAVKLSEFFNINLK